MYIWLIEKLCSKMFACGSPCALSCNDCRAKLGELWEVQYVKKHFPQAAQSQESANVLKEKKSHFMHLIFLANVLTFFTAMCGPSYESHKLMLSRTCFRQYSISDMGKASFSFPLNIKLYTWKTYQTTLRFFWIFLLNLQLKHAFSFGILKSIIWKSK